MCTFKSRAVQAVLPARFRFSIFSKLQYCLLEVDDFVDELFYFFTRSNFSLF
jgi:hypothetical protein